MIFTEQLQDIRAELGTDELASLRKRVEDGFIAWHDSNGNMFFDIKAIEDADGGVTFVPEDPLVADFKTRRHHREMFEAGLAAIDAERVIGDDQDLIDYDAGYIIAVSDYESHNNPISGRYFTWMEYSVIYPEDSDDGWLMQYYMET